MIYLFIYVWLHWVFIAAHRLFLVVTSGRYSLAVVHGLSCPTACEIFPDQRLKTEPLSPVLAGGFLSTGPPGKSTCRFVGSLCAFPTYLISCSANSSYLSSLELGSLHLSSMRLLCPMGFPS